MMYAFQWKNKVVVISSRICWRLLLFDNWAPRDSQADQFYENKKQKKIDEA